MSDAIKTIDLLDGTTIVMTSADSPGYRMTNLVALDAAGVEIWRAALPNNTGSDAYLDVRLENSLLLANTWSGHLVQLTPTTDAIEAVTFVK